MRIIKICIGNCRNRKNTSIGYRFPPETETRHTGRILADINAASRQRAAKDGACCLWKRQLDCFRQAGMVIY